MSIEEGTPISSVEAAVLADQETIIAQGLKTFYAVGTALLTIRDQRLYREDHSTFEVYCQERWGLKQSRAYQYIDAAGVVSDLQSSTIVELPQNEAQARPLAVLPSEQRAAAWQTAVETAPEGKVTAAHVAATVRNIQGPRPATQQEAPDPWNEPDADPDAGLYSRPENVPSSEVTTAFAAAPTLLSEGQRALDTLATGRMPQPPSSPSPPPPDVVVEHERGMAGLDRLTGGKIQRDRLLRSVENAINTVATSDAASVAQATDEDTLARTFEASVTNLERWIGRYRAAKADRHRIVSFVQKGA